MMAYPWSSALTLLVLTQLKGFCAGASCAELRTATPVVHLGSMASASCLITEDCHLTKDPDFDVRFHYNNKLVEGPIPANTSSRAFQISISINVSEPRGFLTCSICRGYCQEVAGLEIRAGFPPSSPQNLSCHMNLTRPEMLKCRWTPGAEPRIPTTCTFCISHTSKGYNYSIPPGVNLIDIPRTDLNLFGIMQVYVRVENALGEANSQRLTLIPMETAIFDKPRIERTQPVPGKYGCLVYHWGLRKDQAWMEMRTLKMELRYKPVDSIVTDEEKVLVKLVSDPKVEVCELLNGTEYQAKMRVRFRQSPWSAWSNQARGTTRETAPNGHLETWLKVSEERSAGYNRAELVWKPSKQFRANSRSIFYIVYIKKTSTRWICHTRERNCTFKIPKWAHKVYLVALNRVGTSKPTVVPVFTNRDLQPVSFLTVLPHGDSALLVQWVSPSFSSLVGYVLECRQQQDGGSSFISFHLLDRNQSSTLLADGIEPYTPYEISVYPKYQEGVGDPRTVVAYAKQKAPSTAPMPKFLDIWHSHVELFWDEIPVSKRNGIIQSYRVFYWDVNGDEEVREVMTTDKRIVLKELKPLTMYKAFIMVSTSGGSLNGSVVTLETGSVDPFAVVLFGIPACAGLALTFIIIIMTTVTHKRLKRLLWPTIPDPANSSIRKWSTTELLQDSPPQKNSMEPALVFLSHFSVVDLTKKELEGKDHWVCQESVSDMYSCSSCQTPETLSSDDFSEPVPYATLVFSGPYQSQPPPPSPPLPAYQRSESTQPLLQEEEPQSPTPFSCIRPYQNVSMIQGKDTEHGFSECEETAGVKITQDHVWEDFPLLHSLEIKEV